MSLLDGLLSRIGYVKAAGPPMPSWLTATGAAEKYTIPPQFAVEKQATLYHNLSWIYIAVSHVAKYVATTDFSVKRLVDEDEEDIPNHPFETLMRRPNPLQSRLEFLALTTIYQSVTGNAYWYLNRPNENVPPLELWIMPSALVRPIGDGRSFISGYEYDPGQGLEKKTYPPWQICHFKEPNLLSRLVGASPLQALAYVAEGDLAKQRWDTDFFAEDNAKPPGALVFKDPVEETAWDKLKADLKRGWGGKRQSGPLLLRGVGNGVEYLQMMFNQKEMEFLDSRKFTKEEIFSVFAPGLANILDVNATEANSIAGKGTLMELAVYPRLVSIAEKVTLDILPVYEDNLIGEFDDVRITNRIVDLAEQERYEKSHTINEIRKEYYSEDPLLDKDGNEDDRGYLIPAEIRPTPLVATSQSYVPPDSSQGEIVSGANPAPVAPAAPPVGMPSNGHGAIPTAKAQADLVRWQRKCVNAIEHMKAPGSVQFVSEDIAPREYARITAGLKAARTIEDIRRVFEGDGIDDLRAQFRDALKRFDDALKEKT